MCLVFQCLVFKPPLYLGVRFVEAYQTKVVVPEATAEEEGLVEQTNCDKLFPA